MAKITIRQKVRGSKTPLPGFIKPQLATRSPMLPKGSSGFMKLSSTATGYRST
jgi:hypothetical protein